jgi:farnesyl-diphosphate farnesyltransferase
MHVKWHLLHRRPILKKVFALLSRPDELWPLLQMALAARRVKRLPQEPNLAFCYGMLNRVSRR